MVDASDRELAGALQSLTIDGLHVAIVGDAGRSVSAGVPRTTGCPSDVE